MRRRAISFGISAAALLIVLSQAEAQAQQGERKGKRGSRVQSARRAQSAATRVVKRNARRASRLRERSRLVEPLIAAAAIKYRVDPMAIWVIAYCETRFRPWLVSPKGAQGLLQFMPDTAKDYGLDNPFDVAKAVDAAARYVRRSSDQFGGRLDLVLASYNAGPGAVDAYLRGVRIVTRSGKVINPRAIKTGGVPPYSETQKYVAKGLRAYKRIEKSGIFSQEVLSRSGRTRMPDELRAGQLMAALPLNDRELDEIGGPQSPMITAGFSKPVASTNTLQIRESIASNKPSASTEKSAQQIEEVFYDIHSGTRYLVRQGAIVKTLEPLKDEASNTPEKSSGQRPTMVARSTLYISRSE